MNATYGPPGHRTDPSAAAPATEAPSLASWERAMQRGHQATAQGHTGVALRHTRQALDVARALLAARLVSAGLSRQAPDDTDHRIAALVVSHHNLADLYHTAHLPDQAAAHVCHAHATLMALLASPDTDTPLQQAAWRHSRETHAALLLFVREKGPHPAVVTALHDHAHPALLCGETRH
ncbi:MAG: hypothetical protein JWP29_579 [Rhodoferax sp.]|nr:hypothetical protein [Rhodoferax sp.]